MGNHTRTDKKLSFRIVIDPPGIAKTMGYYFKFIFDGMVPPYTPIDLYAFTFENIFREWFFVFVQTTFPYGLSYFRRRGKSLTAIQPPIGTPMKAVQCFMAVTDA